MSCDAENTETRIQFALSRRPSLGRRSEFIVRESGVAASLSEGGWGSSVQDADGNAVGLCRMAQGLP